MNDDHNDDKLSDLYRRIPREPVPDDLAQRILASARAQADANASLSKRLTKQQAAGGAGGVNSGPLQRFWSFWHGEYAWGGTVAVCFVVAAGGLLAYRQHEPGAAPMAQSSTPPPAMNAPVVRPAPESVHHAANRPPEPPPKGIRVAPVEPASGTRVAEATPVPERLMQIRLLQQRGETDRARAELANFKESFPAEAIPKDLQVLEAGATP